MGQGWDHPCSIVAALSQTHMLPQVRMHMMRSYRYIYIDIYGLPPTEIHKIAAWCLPRFAEQRPCLSAGKAGFFLGGSFRVQGISACFRSCRLYWGSSSKAFRSRWLFCCLDFGIHMRSDSSTQACKLSTSTCIWTLIPVILKTWFF